MHEYYEHRGYYQKTKNREAFKPGKIKSIGGAEVSIGSTSKDFNFTFALSI